MKGTPVLSAAYDGDMEPVLLLLLLTSMQQGGDLNAALQKFLAFWRENRELILLLARGTGVPPDETKNADTPAEGSKNADTSAEKEDRPPQEDSPVISILEEYLKKNAGS